MLLQGTHRLAIFCLLKIQTIDSLGVRKPSVCCGLVKNGSEFAALALKGIEYEYKAVNLVKGEQGRDEYAAINPSKAVPSICIDGHVINDSIAIMEYLEVIYFHFNYRDEASLARMRVNNWGIFIRRRRRMPPRSYQKTHTSGRWCARFAR